MAIEGQSPQDSKFAARAQSLVSGWCPFCMSAMRYVGGCATANRAEAYFACSNKKQHCAFQMSVDLNALKEPGVVHITMPRPISAKPVEELVRDAKNMLAHAERLLEVSALKSRITYV